jgi:hypothetical protein
MTYMRFLTVSSHLTLGVLVERAFNALKRGKAVVLSDHEAARSSRVQTLSLASSGP